MFHVGQSWLEEEVEKYWDDACVYRADTDLIHSLSVNFQYPSKVVANYFFTIFGPRSNDQETMELVGNDGKILLDRHSGTVRLFHLDGKSEEYDCKTDDFMKTHFGADVRLIRELREFCEGADPRVTAKCGLEATRMVEATFRSADNHGKLVKMKEIPNV